jgi:hypothetical protein
MLFSMGALCCVVAIWCADAAVTMVVTVDEARFQTFSALSRRVHGVPAVAGCAPHLVLGHLQRPRAEGTKWSLFPGDQDRGSSKKQKIAFCERFWFFLSPKNQRVREAHGARVDSPNKQYDDGWTPAKTIDFLTETNDIKMNFVCHPFTRVGQHRVMMLFLFLACAVAMQMSQWNVFDFSAVSSVPSSCVPWDEVRGRKHFACPPSVRMPSGAKLVVSDVGALMMQERVASMSRQTSSPSPFFDLFRTFDEINGQLLAWKNANPTVMNISVIGTTYEGRNISLVTVAKSQNLPVVFLNTGLQ